MTSNIQPGGSLLVAWQLKDRRVVIIGGGEVASQRLAAALSADALVTLIAPRAGLHPATAALLTSPRITYIDRNFNGGASDLAGADMVLTAIDDVSASRVISTLCRTLGIPVNVADAPHECDFYFGAQVRRGPLQVLVSTNGNGPRLAALIKRKIEDALPADVGEAIERVGQLRQKLRERAPGAGGELGRRRMTWMSGICDTWELDELALLDEETMERLLDDGWEQDKISRPSEILHIRRRWRYHNLPYYASSAVFGAGFLSGLVAATTWALIAKQRGKNLL